MMEEELVLCSRKSDLPAGWLGQCGAVRLDWTDLLERLKDVPQHFLPRSIAEEDPHFKQWIPYVVLKSDSGLMACYPRNGTEERLHGCWSVGIGGHVNSADRRVPGERNWWKILTGGMARELEEELSGLTGVPQCLGVINEELTRVGHVHIGLVLEVSSVDRTALSTGSELSGMIWKDPAELRTEQWKDKLEIWSRLALKLTAGNS